MQLKSCTDIKIDDKSVERIRMFGQIVWEKIQETTTTLTISPSTTDTEEEGYYKITKNNTFILRATVISAKGKPVESGKVRFLETIDDNTRCIEEKDIKNGQAELSLQATNPGKRTYTAIFQPTKRYKTSSSNINVAIKKDKPKLSIVGDTGIIYDGWKVGVKMTASDGQPLEGKSFCIHVHEKFYGYCTDHPTEKLTNEKGIVTLNIRSLPVGQHEVHFYFPGDEEYEQAIIAHTYTVEPYKKITLNAYDWSYETGAKYQAWRSDNKKNFYCLEQRSSINSGRTIAAHSGSLNTPAPLIIAFNPPQLSYIASITLKYQSNQIPAVSNSYGGAYFEKAPTVQISFDNVGYHPPYTEEGNQQPINFPSRNYYADFYASYGPIMQNVVWNYYAYNDGAGREPNPGLIHAKIIYEENSGVEEGFLIVEGVELIIEYVDEQKPFWE